MNLEERAGRLGGALAARARLPWLNRAVVLPECGSTQDEAFRLSAGRAGLVVGAIRQNAGRGRLGREWVQPPGLGLAVTFVLDAAGHMTSSVSIRVGCAVCVACEGLVGRKFGVKWPNDVVVEGKKVAGVLIERREGVLLVGVGVNVLQREWPAGLSAESLLGLGGETSLEAVAGGLVVALDRWLFVDGEEVRAEFARRDVVTGTEQTLQNDGKRYTGTIEAIDPEEKITLRSSEGVVHLLPALTSSLVKE